MLFILIFLIGFFTGLRSLTPTAVTAWATRLGWIKLPALLAWIGSLWAVGLFTLLALVELVADKLPKTPARTAPVGLTARILFGALSGACVAAAGGQTLVVGIALGAVGGVAGAFAGYQVRSRFVKTLGAPDFVIALVEDAITIGGSLWVLSRF